MRQRRWFALVLGLVLATVTSNVALATGAWSQAQRVQDLPGTDPAFNTDGFLDGCPFIAPDGKMLFMASTRPGGLGGIDIWVSTRASKSDPWGPASNVGAPINSEQNDFCPTLALDGHTFMFVSNRPGFCGSVANADIYISQLKSKKALLAGGVAFEEVRHLKCDTEGGANSAFDEASPFPQLDLAQGIVLYFSSTRSGNGDIYVSKLGRDGFQAAQQVPGLNTDAVEGQPNVRADGREIFFFSNRTPALGNDIYSAARRSFWSSWGTPVNLGDAVNSSASETRPSLSLDGRTLYFGSTRTGAGDIYVTTR
jgi:Tol biopolymer transport system component